MAVVSCILQKESDGDESNRLWTKRTYRVTMGDSSDTLAMARAAVAALATPTGQGLTKLSADRVSGTDFHIDVAAEYELKLDKGEGSGEEDPADRPSVLTRGRREENEVYFEDCSLVPKRVENINGEPYASLPTRIKANKFLNLTKYYASYSEAAIDALEMTRNSDSVTIKGETYAANELLMFPLAVEEIWERSKGTTYHRWKLTFSLLVDKKTHHLHRIEERGFLENNGASIVRIFFGDKPCAAPWPLNADGSKMSSPTAPPAVTEYKPYASATWGLDFS
jgi:hypothetical protein